MCRIAVLISQNQINVESRIGKMTLAMRHGGPDDTGIYVDKLVALGHNRLSIIDLTSSGHQPMLDQDENFIIIFNGEIFNFQELKEKLIYEGYKFKSSSDTEVILNGYIHWGKEIFAMLNGMFAIVIYDKQNSKIIAARDPLGIKPLYYGKRRGEFYFSSEIRGILAAEPNWDESQVWRTQFLTFGFIPEPNTTLKDVFQLPKSHYLEFCLKKNNYSISKYFEIEKIILIKSEKEAISETRRVVLESIERHLISDVPIGIFLSGGIDSSLLTILTKNIKKQKLKTLSIYFESEKYSEKKYQDVIVNKTGVEHHSFKVTEDEFVESLPDIFEAMDQPSIDGVNSYFITKYAKELGLKVVLSGLGADELFGGYSSFYPSKINSTIQKHPFILKYIGFFATQYPLKKFRFFRYKWAFSDYLLRRGLFVDKDVSRILGIQKKIVWKVLFNLKYLDSLKNESVQNNISLEEINYYMNNQLLKDSDIYSMWHSLELRVPFLDKEILKLVFSIDPKIKFNNSQKKHLLIEAFKDELPIEIYKREKKGFEFPFSLWFKNMKIFSNENIVPKKFQLLFYKNKINYSRLWAIFLSKTYGNYSLVNLKNISENDPTLLILTLSTFNSVGGIEEVNKIILKSLENGFGPNVRPMFWGLHDNNVDNKYYSVISKFKVFNGKKIKFLFEVILSKSKYNYLIITHKNLALAAIILKIKNPKIKLFLFSHGIESWDNNSFMFNFLLKISDKIFAVSSFTKRLLLQNNEFLENKITVLNNCLDPHINTPQSFVKPNYLKKRYNIGDNTKVLFTLSRINSLEGYKGYELVLHAIKKIINDGELSIVYILGGKSDTKEKERIEKLISKMDLSDFVILPGYIESEELSDHYKLADVFVMPSQKEGFGIVFIEAAVNGTPVLGGNIDGSVDAIDNKVMGLTVNPNNIEDIYKGLINIIHTQYLPEEISRYVSSRFSFEKYKNRLISEIKNTF
jgi:asparagine synthase (glutamine-hydrolysing)